MVLCVGISSIYPFYSPPLWSLDMDTSVVFTLMLYAWNWVRLLLSLKPLCLWSIKAFVLSFFKKEKKKCSSNESPWTIISRSQTFGNLVWIKPIITQFKITSKVEFELTWLVFNSCFSLLRAMRIILYFKIRLLVKLFIFNKIKFDNRHLVYWTWSGA